MADATLSNDIEEIIRKAQAQPGISDLLSIYGKYDEVMEQTRIYVEGRFTRANLTLSTNTS